MARERFPTPANEDLGPRPDRAEPKQPIPPPPEPAPPEPPPPVPVRLLGKLIIALVECVVPVRERRPDRWSAWRVQLRGEEVIQIAGAHHQRRALRVTNTGGVAAYLGPGPSISTTAASVTLAAAATRTFDHTAEVFALAAAGDAPTLELVSEWDRTAEAPDRAG